MAGAAIRWRAHYGERKGMASNRAVCDATSTFIRAVAPLPDEALTRPWHWWAYSEGGRFRLGRFDAHLPEHTIQIEKTLAQLGQPPREVARLLRPLHGAPDGLEGTTLGGDLAEDDERQRALAATAAVRTTTVDQAIA